HEWGGTDRRGLRLNEVLTIGDVLNAEVRIDITAERTRDHQIDEGVLRQSGGRRNGIARVAQRLRRDQACILIVLELQADDLHAQGNRYVLGIQSRPARRATVLGHLREEARLTRDAVAVVHERGVGVEFDDFRLIVKIAAGHPPGCTQAVLDVVLYPPDSRAPEVLALLKVVANRHVRHRILDAIVVPRRTNRDVPDWSKSDPQLSALQPLRTELIVRPCQDLADRKLAIQLVQSRGTVSESIVTPHAEPLRHAIERRDARTDY